MKLTDYIMDFFVKLGIKDVFMISGGGAMHLIDSVGKEPRLNYICTQHEQAAAIAAEGYSRTSGKLAVVIVTSGPGGTNAMTGLIGQWLDSVPVLYLSGQVKQNTTIECCREIGLRQLGDQEINIVDIVMPVTKYAAIIKEPQEVRYHLGKAIHLASHGRPGPVWLDIPLDVQAAIIDKNNLKPYFTHDDEEKKIDLLANIENVVSLLKKAKRPVFLAGQGIRIAGANHLFRKLMERVRVPVLTSFCGFDLIPSDHFLFAGRPGTLGSRFGNFVLQNSDLLISIGSRNNIRQVSYNWENFAKNAFKIVVDVDNAELSKPTIKPDLPIQTDANIFLTELDKYLTTVKLPVWNEWLGWCHERRDKYPVVLPEYSKVNSPINSYYFIKSLTEILYPGATVVAGNGTACVCLFQAGKVKENQRIFWNSGCASMGYDLPAAIGACIANDRNPVVCLAGDGSIQMNIQELETMAYYQLPIKLFVLNNGGYVSIRQTQDTFFEGRHVACDAKTGVGFPDFVKVAAAYGLHGEYIRNLAEMEDKIRSIIDMPGPVVCEVFLDPRQKFSPRVSSQKQPDGKIISKPLEDMFPFLPRDEFDSNMIVK